jgi:hypothetical protein
VTTTLADRYEALAASAMVEGRPAPETVERLKDELLFQRATQTFPSLGSRDNPTQEPDGSTRLYFGPTVPEGRSRHWLRTVPGRGFFAILRLYGPTEAIFDQSWKPGDLVELVQ